MFVNKYPYTDMHELNLDWILGQMMQLRTDMKDFINQNTIKYADPIQWNITTQYEGNTVVIEPNSGNAYISSQPVPAGVAITNTDYWNIIGNFSVLYESIKEGIAAADDGSNINATEARAEGSLLWINSKLYKVLSDISVGALYITSGAGQNLEEVTIEELLNDEAEARKADVIAINSSILNIVGQIEKLETKTNWFVSSFPGDASADKLQNAIDYAIANYSGDVIVDIDIDLTGKTINLTKGLSYSDSNYLRRRGKLNLKGINGSKIYKNDQGYFFSADSFSGDFGFSDLQFVGNVILGGADDEAARDAGNSVFDCTKLIRITTVNCSYTLVGVVFDGKGSTMTPGTPDNMQSIRNYGDVCTYSLAYYRITNLWDCVSFGCLIENCAWGYRSYGDTGSINALTIDGCDLESCTRGAISLAAGGQSFIMTNINILNSYFEANATYAGSLSHISINSPTTKCLRVVGCRFAFTQNDEICVNTVANETGNILMNNLISGSYTGRLVYVTTTRTNGRYPILLFENNIGSSRNSNNGLLAYNMEYYSLFKAYESVAISGLGSDANNISGFNLVHSSADDPLSNVPAQAGDLLTLRMGGGVEDFVQFYFRDTGTVHVRFKTTSAPLTTWKQITLT